MAAGIDVYGSSSSSVEAAWALELAEVLLTPTWCGWDVGRSCFVWPSRTAIRSDASDRDVIGEQLERDDRENGAQGLVGVGNPPHVVRVSLDLFVALRRDGQDAGVAGPTLHHVADQLVVDPRSGGDRHERVFGVEQGD